MTEYQDMCKARDYEELIAKRLVEIKARIHNDRAEDVAFLLELIDDIQERLDDCGESLMGEDI